jgi:SH3-like domain-containing protein
VTASALNIRSGPGVEFPSVPEPLKRGVAVLLLEQCDRWSKVEMSKNGDIEGWVRNQFLKKV